MAGGSLGELVISLSADLARFQSDMGKANKIANDTMSKMAADISGGISSIEGMFSKVGTVFAGATAVLAGGAMFKSMIDATKGAAGEVQQLSKSLGISAEQASVLRVALDDAFLTAEQMTSGASRLTKQLLKNEEAFHNLGVETRQGPNKELRNTVDIMADVNSKLLQFKEGTDRNIEGMKIYGKGWEEARGLLKLTAEAMTEAKERANRLHLVFGDEGLKAVRDYKLAMKDLDDVAESFKVTIGRNLIGVLTDLSVAFGEAGASAADGFADGLRESLRSIAEAKLTIQDIMAKGAAIGQGGPIAAVKAWLTEAGRKEIKAEIDAQEQMYQYSMEKIAERYGKPVKARKPEKSGEHSTGADETAADTAYATQLKAAADAYRNYLKADAEAEAAFVRASSAQLEEINKNAYAAGLIDLQAYLETKHQLNETALAAELKAKQSELAEARKAEKEALAAYEKDSTGDTAKNANDAYAKVAQAIKGVTEAESKLALAKIANGEETRKATEQELAGYRAIEAQLLTMQGNFLQAELSRQAAERETEAYRQLEANALAGVEEAERALADKKALWHKADIDAMNLDTEAAQKYADELRKIQDEISLALGADAAILAAQNAVKDAIKEREALQRKLNAAEAAGNAAEVQSLQSQIQLQDIINQRKQRELELIERKGVLTGQIVGFRNGIPVMADEYQKQQGATGYVPDAMLVGANGNTTTNANSSVYNSALNVSPGAIVINEAQNPIETAKAVREGIITASLQTMGPINGGYLP